MLVMLSVQAALDFAYADSVDQAFLVYFCPPPAPLATPLVVDVDWRC